MNKISVKETPVTARDLRVILQPGNKNTLNVPYFCDPSVQLGTSSIIPAMEYHFVKDLGNRDALSGL